MADAFDVATRKGLFRFERRGDGWRAGPPDFLGEPVSAYLRTHFSPNVTDTGPWCWRP